MNTATNLATANLELRRTLDAPIERVFNAWADPAAIAKWMGPSDEMQTLVEAHDFRLGGQYRYRLISKVASATNGPVGENHVVSGSYIEINPPTRLVFTWRWIENGMDVGETLVSLDFIDRGTQTELVLLHEKLPTDEARDAHQEGWEGCLDCLARFLHH